LLILQFDLLTMTLDRQYLLNNGDTGSTYIVINKSQTLCAITVSDGICILSMESGVLISKFFYDHDNNWTGWYIIIFLIW
jgi:hypothetical protein